jgi:hypothetical protein
LIACRGAFRRSPLGKFGIERHQPGLNRFSPWPLGR